MEEKIKVQDQQDKVGTLAQASDSYVRIVRESLSEHIHRVEQASAEFCRNIEQNKAKECV